MYNGSNAEKLQQILEDDDVFEFNGMGITLNTSNVDNNVDMWTSVYVMTDGAGVFLSLFSTESLYFDTLNREK